MPEKRKKYDRELREGVVPPASGTIARGTQGIVARLRAGSHLLTGCSTRVPGKTASPLTRARPAVSEHADRGRRCGAVGAAV